MQQVLLQRFLVLPDQQDQRVLPVLLVQLRLCLVLPVQQALQGLQDPQEPSARLEPQEQ